MSARLATGVTELDRMLSGGLPQSSSVLFEGLPGCGKDCLAYTFLFNQLKDGSACFIVYSAMSNREIKEIFATHGMHIDEFEHSNLLYWIDTAGRDSGETVIRVEQATLSEISIALVKYLEQHKGRRIAGVIQFLDAALMLNTPETIYKFLENLISKLKQYDLTAIFLLEKSMHDPKNVTMLESLSDGVVEFRLMESGMEIFRALRVLKMRGVITQPSLRKFELTAKGIVFA